ncbi:MAG: DUF4255 domain-containing protein [Bacteroidota bacterium]|nr:DUF4255 domain-containing protein [Bacteroidota bacterium]
MIDQVLQYIVAELNRYFRVRFGLNENIVVLSGLVNMDGTPALQQDNKIVLTMLNVEQEKVVATNGNYQSSGDRTSKVNPPVFINLYLLFSGYFPGSNYAEALKFISGVITFFQSNISFAREDASGLPDGVDKIVFDLQKFTYQDLSHIWGMLGSKHMPSVGYKLRMLMINDNQLREQLPIIREATPKL